MGGNVFAGKDEPDEEAGPGESHWDEEMAEPISRVGVKGDNKVQDEDGAEEKGYQERKDLEGGEVEGGDAGDVRPYRILWGDVWELRGASPRKGEIKVEEVDKH